MLTALTIMEGLQEAAAILFRAKAETSFATASVWNKLDHAANHIDAEMAIFLADPEDLDGDFLVMVAALPELQVPA